MLAVKNEIVMPVVSTGDFSFGEAHRHDVKEVTDWQAHLKELFPQYLWNEFSDPQIALWEWAARIGIDKHIEPFISIWPRARGKSTNAEMLAADMGAQNKRKYCMYFSETQSQADRHISTISSMLESNGVASYNPFVSYPRISKNGGRSWSRRTVTTESGYTAEGIGLNKATRGQKVDWARIDLLIGDDFDGLHDTEATIRKKIEIITDSILPARNVDDCAILFCQNMIHANSIIAQLAKRPDEDGAAQWLTERHISGPHPAVEGLHYEMRQDGDKLRWVITSGKSLWRGFDIETCENEINTVGPDSYELEYQHNVDADNPLALLKTEIFNATRRSDYPDLVRIVVGVDPSGGAGGCGIVATGKAKIGPDWHGFTIDNRSTPPGTPSSEWAEAALWCYHVNRADCLVVEKNFGGDMAEANIRNAVIKDASGKILLSGKSVNIIMVTASRGKQVRAEPVATLFQLGKMHHVGNYSTLQRQWTAWEPGTLPSPDELDAEVWAVTELGLADSGATVYF